MAADVDPVAVVDMGAGNAADIVRGLKNQRDHVGAARQLQRRRQAGGAAPRDHRDFSPIGHLNRITFRITKFAAKLAPAATILAM